MVFKRYIKRGGKVYGPYLYESKRVDGKVVTKYLGLGDDGSKNISVLFFVFFILIALSGMVFALSDDLHVNVQTTNSSGSVINGTFTFKFDISKNSDCSSPLYTDTVALTTDSRGIVSHYLTDVSLNFSDEYYLCYYRDAVLINSSRIVNVPYSMRAQNITLSGVEPDTNLNMGGYNITADTGFFNLAWSYLTSVPSLIYDIWTGNNANSLLVSNGTAIGYNESVFNSSVLSIGNANGWASTYNATYALWAYNQTLAANAYTDEQVALIGSGDFSFSDFQSSFTSNASALIDTYNATWDQGYLIKWNYNQTLAAINYVDLQGFLTSVGDDSIQLKYQNISNIPTCTGTQKLSFDGTSLSCADDEVGEPGAGDIESVQGDFYITNGSNTAAVNLVFNETRLNATILSVGSVNGWASTYNESYAGLINNASYLSTYNATYALWAYNQSDGYLSEFDYNHTSAVDILYGADYRSTYNATYAGLINNASYLSTYNATYATYGSFNTTENIASLISGGTFSLANLNVTNTLRVGDSFIASSGSGLNITSGEVNIGGSWSDGGVTISDGSLFAQTVYVYNVTSLGVSTLNINGSLLPQGDFDNTFDIGSASLQWRDVYVGRKIYAVDWSNVTIEESQISDLQTDAYLSTYNATYNTWAYNQTVLYTNGSGLNLDNYEFSLQPTIYYNATSTEVVVGTPDGSSTSINAYDGTSYDITEGVGSPGLDFRINFTGVADFNQLVVRYKSSAGESHTMYVQIWDYDSSDWENYLVLSSVGTYETKSVGIYDPTAHDVGGVVSVRFYSASNGNPSDVHYFDWVTISSGIATPSGKEIDPYFEGWLGEPKLQNNLNLTNVNASTSGWFKGLFNWTAVADWLSFDGATLTFNETKLNVTIGQYTLNLTDTNDSAYIASNEASWLSTYNATYDAKNSSRWASDGQNISYSLGNVGIGTATPSQLLDINGDYQFLNPTDNYFSSTIESIPFRILGDATYSPLIHLRSGGTGVDWFTYVDVADSDKFQIAREGSDVFTIDGSGQVGIGTATPSEKLEVLGNMEISNGNADGSDIGYLNFFGTAGGSSGNHARITGYRVNSGEGQLIFSTKSGGSLSDKVWIKGDGKVGIGTDTPLANLHLAASSVELIFTDSDGDFPKINISNPANGDTRITGPLNNDLIFGTLANTAGEGFIFEDTTGASLLHIDAVGKKIGIGTSTPNSALEVVGNVNSSKYFLGDTGIGIDDSGNNLKLLSSGGVIFVDETEPQFQLKDGSTNKVVLDTAGNSYFLGGNVGIGTDTPTAKLHVIGNATFDASSVTGAKFLFKLDNDASGAVPEFEIQSEGGTSYFSVKDGGATAGYVGIGTATPSNKLDVRGDINASGEIYFNNGTAVSSLGGSSGLWETNGTAIYNATVSQVGIGTATPVSPLNIYGADPVLTIQDSQTTATSAISILRLAESGVAGVLGDYWDVKLENSKFIITDQLGASKADRLVIDDSGNIGIGTDTPTTPLEIAGSHSVRNNTLNIHDTIGAVQDDIFGIISFTSADNSSGLAGEERASIRALSGNEFGSAGDLVFYTRDFTTYNEKMRILSTGNVGIGTDTPGGLLNIVGTGNHLNLSNAGAGASQLIMENSEGRFELRNDGGKVLFYEDGGSKMTIEGGNVGIGTTTPSNKLDVRGDINASGEIYFNNGTAVSSLGGGSSAWVSSGNYLYNDTAFVGIGTDTPSGLFHVKMDTGQILLGDTDALYNGVGINISEDGAFSTVSIGNAFTGGKKLVVGGLASDLTYTGNAFTIGDGGAGDPIINFDSGNDAYIQWNEDEKDLVFVTGGDVGIGTTNPTKALQIDDNEPIILLKRLTDNTKTSGFQIQPFGSITPSNNLWNIGLIANENHFTFRWYNGSTVQDPFTIESSTPENTLYLDNAGYVGIGTDSPDEQLDIIGDVEVTGAIYASTSTGYKFGGVAKSEGTSITSPAENDISFNNSGSYTLYLHDDNGAQFASYLNVYGKLKVYACPAGFTRTGLGCIQTAEEGSGTWESAQEDCYDTHGGRLPTLTEWTTAINNHALTDETDDAEWVDHTVYDGTLGANYPCAIDATAGTTAQYEDCASYGWFSTAAYRCFVPFGGG